MNSNYLKYVMTGWLIGAGFLMIACDNVQTQPQVAAGGPVPGSSSTPAEKEVDPMAKSLAQRRYTRPSTEVNYILVKIGRANGENCDIVIDNSDWMRYCPALGIKVEPIEAYVQTMLEHENTAWLVSDENYTKLAKYAAAAPLAEWQALSRQDILQKFFFENDNRDFVLKNEELRYQQNFLRLLIEKGFIVKVDCEANLLNVR